MVYTGLPEGLKRKINRRDGRRCRWCGSTNSGVDHHHINYRRGVSDDVLENLVSLCRSCHSFIHGNPRPGGQRIIKAVAQEVLFEVIATPGLTGSALWRQKKRQWAEAGLCDHGLEMNDCFFFH